MRHASFRLEFLLVSFVALLVGISVQVVAVNGTWFVSGATTSEVLYAGTGASSLSVTVTNTSLERADLVLQDSGGEIRHQVYPMCSMTLIGKWTSVTVAWQPIRSGGYGSAAGQWEVVATGSVCRGTWWVDDPTGSTINTTATIYTHSSGVPTPRVDLWVYNRTVVEVRLIVELASGRRERHALGPGQIIRLEKQKVTKAYVEYANTGLRVPAHGSYGIDP